MDSIIKIVQSAYETYAVGQEIYETNYRAAKRTALTELAKVAAIIATLALVLILTIGFIVTSVVCISFLLSAYYSNPNIVYGVPMLMMAIIALTSWLKRKSIFLFFVRKTLNEVLDV